MPEKNYKELYKKELKKSWQKLKDGFLLAGVALVSSVPRIYYQSYYFFPQISTKPANALVLRMVFLYHFILGFCVLFIMILIGSYACERAKIKPFVWKGIWKFLGAVLLGVLVIAPGYWIFDRIVLALIPSLYPDRLWLALVYPFSASFADELIWRYGFLSLALWIFGGGVWRKNLANAFVSAIVCALALQELFRFTSEMLKASEIIFLTGGLFMKNLLVGEVYMRYGFFQSLALRIGIEFRYIFFFWLLR